MVENYRKDYSTDAVRQPSKGIQAIFSKNIKIISIFKLACTHLIGETLTFLDFTLLISPQSKIPSHVAKVIDVKSLCGGYRLERFLPKGDRGWSVLPVCC